MKYFEILLINFVVVYATSSSALPFSENFELEGFPECDPNNVTWHPHPYSCTRYVLCFHGNPIERLCAPGLHFNRFMEQCQPPQLARCDINYACPTVDDEMNPVYLPDETDCSRYFVCFRGSPISRECAQDLWFDVVYNWCTFADQVTCDSKAPNNPNTPPPPTDVPVDTTVAPTLPPAPTDAPTTTTQNPNVYECPLSAEPSFHPHSRECELYFICVNGVAFLRRCADQMIFDIIHRECNERDFATCISGTSEVDVTPTEKYPINSNSIDCPLGSADEILVPHNSRCERYYVCRKGIAYLNVCPVEQHYDFTKQVCEAKSEVFCFNDLQA